MSGLGDNLDILDDIFTSLDSDSSTPIDKEIYVNPKTKLPRQAGTDRDLTAFIPAFKQLAEQNLFVFSKGVMGRRYMTRGFHRPVADWIQQCPPYRKGTLLPRGHGKTSLVAHCLPIHILIQPASSNVYFPGMQGTECRILLSGEKEDRASDNLRVISTNFESNRLLRALWPEACWENPKREAKKWNDHEIILPRDTIYPDPTIRAVGVNVAVTGSRPNVQIKDDLISIKAANSQLVMQDAINWHVMSRALMDEYETETGLASLEWIIGTKWAVWDLYSFIMEGDPDGGIPADETYEWLVKGIVEDGEPIWPERFTMDKIEQLRVEFGNQFYLQYMNSASNQALIDFDVEMLRSYEIHGTKAVFPSDPADAVQARRLKDREDRTQEANAPKPGDRMSSAEYMNSLRDSGQAEYMWHKYGKNRGQPKPERPYWEDA